LRTNGESSQLHRAPLLAVALMCALACGDGGCGRDGPPERASTSGGSSSTASPGLPAAADAGALAADRYADCVLLRAVETRSYTANALLDTQDFAALGPLIEQKAADYAALRVVTPDLDRIRRAFVAHYRASVPRVPSVAAAIESAKTKGDKTRALGKSIEALGADTVAKQLKDTCRAVERPETPHRRTSCALLGLAAYEGFSNAWRTREQELDRTIETLTKEAAFFGATGDRFVKSVERRFGLVLERARVAAVATKAGKAAAMLELKKVAAKQAKETDAELAKLCG
jgi:hypothetical protein